MPTFDKANIDDLDLYLDEDKLAKLLRTRKPFKLFPCDMTDMFGEWVPDEWLDKIFSVAALTPHITWQVLTKRPERMREYVTDPRTAFRVARQMDVLRVAEQIRKTPYVVKALPWDSHYLIANDGSVFTDHGSATCVWCGKIFDSGPQDTIYCSQKCRSASHYAKSQGRQPEPSGRTIRPVTIDSSGDGYQRFRRKTGGRELVHRVVLAVFDRSPSNKEQARHLDGNPANNHICNLRWGDQEQNWEDSKRHGTHRRSGKLTHGQVKEIRERRGSGESASSIANAFNISDTQVYNISAERQHKLDSPLEWPPKNCWLGVSVENQETADERIPHLLQTPAAVRFVSYEPALGPLACWFDTEVGPLSWLQRHNLMDDEWTEKIDWIIVGGESGPKARPCDLAWIRSLRDQCRESGTALFVKQVGRKPIWSGETEWVPSRFAGVEQKLQISCPLSLKDSHGGDISEWPPGLRDDPQIREFPT